MAWVNQTKNSSSFENNTKIILDSIYFVAENLDTYDVGGDILAIKDETKFVNQTKYGS